jgi:hypothetical protein
MDRRTIRYSWRLRILPVLLAAATAIVPMSPDVIERWYSTGIYPHVQRTLTPVSNLLPIAVLDIAVCGAVGWILWVWIRAIRVAWRERSLGHAGRMLLDTVAAGAIVYLIFLALWGLNYRRLPMSSRLVIAGGVPSTDAVVALGMQAARRLDALYARAHTAGWREPVWRSDALRTASTQVQAQLVDSEPTAPGRLKPTIFGRFFRWTSVDGMVNPFGLEVLVNPDLLPFERPFVAAHEWAHLSGYADESEANFVGWLTCLHADVSDQYSGWLYLYWQVSGELGDRDRRRLAETLAQGPRDDLRAIAVRLRRGNLPLLRRASWLVYDQYLKANRVDSGVRSYGAVVTLILQARFEGEWRPLRRGADPPAVPES